MSIGSWDDELHGTLSNNAVELSVENRARIGCIVSNNSDTVMTLREGGNPATAGIGVSIPPGSALVLKGDTLTVRALSLFCAGASKAYTFYEW